MAERCRRAARLGVVLAVAVAGGGAVASAAEAIEFKELGGAVTDSSGEMTRQAGAHSDIRFRFSVPDTGPTPSGVPPRAAEQIHRLKVDVPLGLVGNPQAAETCTETELTARANGGLAGCPTRSQVGSVDVFGVGNGYPVYNLEPPAGVPAMFGFNAFGVIVKLRASVRPDDFGITIDTAVVTQADGGFTGSDITFWGVPADPMHDPLRWNEDSFFPSPPATFNGRRLPFMTTPTSCPGMPETTTASMDGWRSIGQFVTQSFSSDLDDVPFVGTGCDRLGFDPTVDIEPTSRRADSPTGLEFELKVPQNLSPDALATAHVKDVSVALPEGMSVSPSAANGLQACTDEQVGLGAEGVERCPDASKIGSVTVDTPVLPDPLLGSIYVASQQSDDPQSGKMFRLFLVAEGAGARIKLEGGVKANPDTGQLTAVFENNPQLPFDKLRATFDGGPQAPLATPATCGQKTANVGLTSWSGKAVGRQPVFAVGCAPGLGGFSPTFTAGTASPVAGGFSPFVVGITKPDGDSAIDGLSVEMPKGVLAKLKGNLGTQVGSVTAFAGSGSSPFPLPGKVFLEGAYGDAPYSLRVVVPAKAGPFDLGDVVVRQKVYVDRASAQVKVVSDPIPTIVKGVPTRLQRLDVNVDKPGFMVNPTNCEASEVKATLRSAAGQSAPLNARFQVGSCGDLGFSPKLAMALTGKKQVTTGKHPGIKARLRQASGQAGIGKAKVALPSALALDPDNAQALCEFTDGTKPDLENHCPKGSIVGRARASTPLLERDLTGDVYFVKNVRKDKKTGNEIRTLPMIVVALRGEIAINLRGEASTTKSGRLVSTFANVPDAPISAFNLNIQGGTNGILAVTRTRKSKINLCAKPTSHRAAIDLDGHNGRDADFNTTVKTPCGKKSKKASKKKK